MSYEDIIEAIEGEDHEAARAAVNQLREDLGAAVDGDLEVEDGQGLIDAMRAYFVVAEAHQAGDETFFDDTVFPVWWRLRWKDEYLKIASNAVGVPLTDPA